MNAIVQVNVNQISAPTPSTLQSTGALVSQGGTTLTPGSTAFLSQLGDLTNLLVTPPAISGTTWSTNVATVTTVAPHGLTVNNTYWVTIAGVTSTTAGAYNGSFLATVTGASTFTYSLPLGGTPGSGTGGTWAPMSRASLTQMATTFFSQGSSQGVYVLELGTGNPSQGALALDAWIAANPGIFYAYLVPRTWDSNPDYLNLLAGFNTTTSKTYFFTTTTIQNYINYTTLMKCCFAMIEAPSYGKWVANPLTGLSFSGSWGANVLTAASWAATSGGQATFTTTTAHTVSPGQTVVITGNTPTGYNGTFTALPGTNGSTIIVAMPTNPGVNTVLGSLAASAFGTATATTATAHSVLPGNTFSIAGSTPTGYNGTFTALPGTTGSTILYSLPADPGAETVLGTLVASSYASTGAASSEFSCAAPFQAILSASPSTTNKVTPTSFKFLSGVTPFPLPGNGPILAALKAAYVNVVGTGGEGGISNAMLTYGTTKDGRKFNYWYSVDWVAITGDEAVANAVINGSNDTLNPLYFNQSGINRLQEVLAGVMNEGLSFGMVLGAVTSTALDQQTFLNALDTNAFPAQTVVNAVPFVPYTKANPGDFKIGKYAGLSVIFTPNNGFDQIVITINVTDFVSQ